MASTEVPDNPLYAERPEWADVVPIPQNDDIVNAVAPIFYTAMYKDATDYFRGIVKTGEKSQRVLDLTMTIIYLNPAHYSAWQYRYQTLLAISAPLDAELKLMDSVATDFLKTYQVWHHRRLLLTYLGPAAAADELAFIARALRADAKNYHTWSYRQWVLAHFNTEALWASELAFVESMLQEDVRNNSAWHHRHFVVWASGAHVGDEDRTAILHRELSYTKSAIALAPNNGSAWNYLRGTLDATKTPFATLEDFVLPYTDPNPDPGSDVVDLENPRPSAGADLPCAAAIEFMADVRAAEDGTQAAIDLWKSLAEKHDMTRRKYWEFRIHEAQHLSAT